MMTDTSSIKSTRILLVRHGESLANAGGVTPDHITIPLTEHGHAQAKALAEALPCTPTLFLHSPFLRTRQTAEPLLQRFPEVPVEEWPIHEFTYLEPARHNGTSIEQQMPHILQYWNREDPVYRDGPGAESFKDFLDRGRVALDRFTHVAPGGCVVVFTHGFMMQAFRMLLLFPHATDAELMSNFRRFHFVHFIENTELVELEAFNGQLRMVGQLHLNSFAFQGETSHA